MCVCVCACIQGSSIRMVCVCAGLCVFGIFRSMLLFPSYFSNTCSEICICAFLDSCWETCYVDITLHIAATSRWQPEKRWDVFYVNEARIEAERGVAQPVQVCAECLRCWGSFWGSFCICLFEFENSCVFENVYVKGGDALVHMWVGSGGLWTRQMDIWSSFAPWSKTHTSTNTFTLPRTPVTLTSCNSSQVKAREKKNTSSAHQITYRHTYLIFQLSKHRVSQNHHNNLTFPLCPEKTSQAIVMFSGSIKVF